MTVALVLAGGMLGAPARYLIDRRMSASDRDLMAPA